MTSPLTLDVAKKYLGIDLDDDSRDEEVQDAIDAETAAQSRVCRMVEPFPVDMLQALKRRVARNLALRNLPLMVPRGDAEVGALVPPGRDPEVRRLEGPHRRLVVG